MSVSKISIIKDAAEKAMAAENERTKLLLGRAEKFTAGIIVVTGFQLVSLPNVLGASSPWAGYSSYLALAALGLSLFFGFYSLRLKGHAGYPRGDKLLENLKPDEVSEDAAEQAIIQLLLKNREQNAKLNDTKAISLSWCGWLFFAGFLLAAGSQFLVPLANISPVNDGNTLCPQSYYTI
jgi:hypothetical protein